MTDTLVVLGASGDMARRLLFPGLFKLALDGSLPDVKFIGYALDQWDGDRFVQEVKNGITSLAGLSADDAVWSDFAGRLSYRSGDISAGGLAALAPEVHGNVAFYLALPPSLFGKAADALAGAGLNKTSDGWRRLVLEKPFGIDVQSAQSLNQELRASWDEEQIYRIDHYLGKETVQNILVFRFANRFIDPLLNSHHVEYVQLTAAETLGLEGRYRYYDGIGALRDMLQSHLLQLLAITAMEPPSLWDADLLHDHKAEVLRSVRPIRPEDVAQAAVRGQYVAGSVNGKQVGAYRDEQGVTAGTRTETFAALKLYIDNWRWHGVPFYLRSGKHLKADVTEVAIQFRAPPKAFFRGDEHELPANNRLVFRLRPSESINLSVQARVPGLETRSHELELRADYAKPSDQESSSYEALLLDVFAGDRTPFLRYDEVEWAWRIVQPVLDAWQTGQPAPYAAGSEGPPEQDGLMEPGQRWRSLDVDAEHRGRSAD